MTRAVVGSQPSVVDNQISHTWIVSQAREVDSRIHHKLNGSQAMVIHVPTTHAFTGPRDRVVDALTTHAGAALKVLKAYDVPQWDCFGCNEFRRDDLALRLRLLQRQRLRRL